MLHSPISFHIWIFVYLIFCRPNGSYFCYFLTLSPLLKPHGPNCYATLTSININKKKKNEVLLNTIIHLPKPIDNWVLYLQLQYVKIFIFLLNLFCLSSKLSCLYLVDFCLENQIQRLLLSVSFLLSHDWLTHFQICKYDHITHWLDCFITVHDL